MFRISKILSAASLSVMMVMSSFGSTFAMPLPNVHGAQASNVEQVQYRHGHRVRPYHGGHRNWNRHGHRSYRHHHGSNAGAVIGGLAAGAIIGGALASQPRASGGSHVQWCSAQYRTYRASDNTYVPRAGVRAQCNSPYN